MYPKDTENRPRRNTLLKKILIIDEPGFSKVCSAILRAEGCACEVLSEPDSMGSAVKKTDYDLIITSYPFCVTVFDMLKAIGLPTIILSDQINKELINTLQGFNNSYCMIKPLDFEKFRSLVNQIAGSNLVIEDGYKII